MTLEDERELVKRAASDPEAFGALFDEYYPKIFGYVCRRVGNVDYARDLTSEVFLKAFKGIWRFRWQGVSVSSWFYRIATNEVNGYYRKNRPPSASLNLLMEEQGFDPPDPKSMRDEKRSIETQMEHHSDYNLILSKLKLLPLKYQEVISLRYFEDKSVAEIGKILGKKEGTVKSLLSRGLEKVRKLL